MKKFNVALNYKKLPVFLGIFLEVLSMMQLTTYSNHPRANSHIGNRGSHGCRAGTGQLPTRRSQNIPLTIITDFPLFPLQPSDIKGLSKRGNQNYQPAIALIILAFGENWN